MIKNIEAVIRKKTFLNKNTVELIFEKFEFDFEAGQFLMLQVPNFFLRRPFVILKKNNFCSIIFKICGEGTIKLSELSVGATLNLLLPLGNFFPSPATKKLVLIGGGVGVVSLVPIIEKYFNTHELTTFLGFNTKTSIFYEDYFKKHSNLNISTDDGTYSFRGSVVKNFEEKINEFSETTIFACGPSKMLHSLQGILIKNNFKNVYFSLEEKMACGVGACLSCAISTKNGIKRVCKDGPVFNAFDLTWEQI